MRTRSENSPLCRRCRMIDLDMLFRKTYFTKAGAVIHRWQHLTEPYQLDNCSLCQLIMKSFYLSKEQMRKNELNLRSYSSSRILDRGWASVNITMLSLHHHRWPSIVSQPKGRDIDRLLRPHVDFEIVKYWLRYCGAHHIKTCASISDKAGLNAILSLKLIDCDNNKIIPANGMPYVALSYLWGGGVTTEIPFTAALPADMPRTIKDAITTRALGFRYLWVDRYCINQSCPAAQQVHKMDLIYNNAELTIIAAAGKNAEYGLPGVSPRRVVQPPARIGKHFLVGWTYQEGLHSRRRLVFTYQQVYFECCEIRFNSSFCSGVNLGMFPRQLGRTGWEVVQRIEEYSAKTLTNSSDILNGVSGILRALGKSPQKIRHCRGVPFLLRPPKLREMRLREEQEAYDSYEWSPTIDFCNGLCWNVDQPLTRRDGFPSWSWTGWEGAIKWELDEWDWKRLGCTSDVQFKVHLDEYFERVTDPSTPSSDTLLLSGLVTPLWLISGLIHDRISIKREKIQVTSLAEDGKLVKWEFTVTAKNLDVQKLGKCVAFELARVPGFPLRRFVMVVTETEEQGVYQRIGFAKLRNFGLDWDPENAPPLGKTWMEFRLR
ncbi:heterokaryon incompatibility protein-domain-containing protein [Mariannaea sp. PMI_226]|nr:heterokaryon incompatibility protein-domain-containing protein [Mariannaea sp. PMI_226]